MGERSTGASYFGVILVSAITSALVAVGTLVAFQRLGIQVGAPEASEPASVEVPDVSGMRASAAGELLEVRGLQLVISEERPDPRAERGAIAAQDPLAGSRVERGTPVAVVVSSGPPKVVVPDLVGRPIAEVRAELEALGLAVGEVSETGQGEPGAVTGLDPLPGTEVDPGARIRLTAAPSGSVVPDLAGLTRRRATEALEAVGLTLGRVRWRFHDGRPAYTVLDQTPAAGTQVPPGTAVEVVLNEE